MFDATSARRSAYRKPAVPAKGPTPPTTATITPSQSGITRRLTASMQSSDMTTLVGQAWLAAGTELRRDPEHDAHEWWPADPADWPEHAHPQLHLLAALLVP